MEEKVIEDLEHHLDNIKEFDKWLTMIYYNPEFATITTKPVLTHLSQGAKHLITNLVKIRKRHLD